MNFRYSRVRISFIGYISFTCENELRETKRRYTVRDPEGDARIRGILEIITDEFEYRS